MQKVTFSKIVRPYKYTTQGFTLIELLIVIAIIGILAAVLIPNLLNAQKRAYDAGAQSCGKSIQTAVAVSYIDTGSYPTIINKNISNLGAACAPSEIAVVGNGTQSSYSFTASDSRGLKTFTFTPSGMTKN